MAQLKRYNGTSWEYVGGTTAPKTSRTSSNNDTYSCNYINSLNDYSTSETRIGTWIDGKPLYRKVYKITSGLSTRTEYTLDLASLNIDLLIRLDGFEHSNAFKHIPMNFYNNGDYNYMFYGFSHNKVYYKFNWDASEVYFILEYTKTTD